MGIHKTFNNYGHIFELNAKNERKKRIEGTLEIHGARSQNEHTECLIYYIAHHVQKCNCIRELATFKMDQRDRAETCKAPR